MEQFSTVRGIAAPIDRPNVDTDAIIPKQYLKSIHRSGFGPNLFDEWRYLDQGEPGMDCSKRKLNSEFVLNRAPYSKASILLTRENFGCGSSREHAVWALADYGIRCLVGSSFADIFYSNCSKNGLLAARLAPEDVDVLFTRVTEDPGTQLTVDLNAQTVADAEGRVFEFEIEAAIKSRLLAGLDDIGITLQYAEEIRAFELERLRRMPWL